MSHINGMGTFHLSISSVSQGFSCLCVDGMITLKSYVNPGSVNGDDGGEEEEEEKDDDDAVVVSQ